MNCSKLINHLAIFLPILFICNNLSANDIAEQKRAEQQDVQAKQIIESERRDLIRRKESEEVRNIGKAKEEAVRSIIDKTSPEGKTCRAIKEFRISGNGEVYSWTLNRKFIKPLQNLVSKREVPSCFTKSDLIKLDDQIVKYYQQQGYVLARVYFDTSELSSGLLKIIIEEGKLEKLEILDNSKLNKVLPFRRSTERFFAFPSLWKDSKINIRDIEQGIDQFNRLNSQKAKINFMPAKQAGFSNIIIENQIANHLNLSFGTDNSGQKTTGKIKHKVSLNYDNLLAINDNIYLNYSESNAVPLFGSSKGFNDIIGVDDNSNNRFSKAFYSSFSAPYGYWTLGSSYSYSKYQLTALGRLSQVKASGNSEEKTYYLDRVLSRDKRYKISLKAELRENDTDSYFGGTYIPVNSRRTAEGNFLLNGVFYFPFGILNIQPKYSKGLSVFGAMKDNKNLPKASPHAQFETYGLYAQSNINFKIPKISIPFNHKLTIDAVKSDDTLYGSDKFILGGRYSLRGFQESIISGDSGYSVKNDLSVNVADFLPNLILASKLISYGDKHSLATKLSKLNVGIFHDFGYVRNHIIDSQDDKGYMSGAGIALNYYGNLSNWNIVYSKGLHSPRFLQNIDNISKDNETIYFSLNLNLGFL
jgi:hemolysin activation/secretion protein